MTHLYSAVAHEFRSQQVADLERVRRALVDRYEDVIGALYDGSWREWGSRTDTPVETKS